MDCIEARRFLFAVALSSLDVLACGGRTGLAQIEAVGDDGGSDAEMCTGSGDSGPQPPSCAPGGLGMTNCGAGGESCCTAFGGVRWNLLSLLLQRRLRSDVRGRSGRGERISSGQVPGHGRAVPAVRERLERRK